MKAQAFWTFVAAVMLGAHGIAAQAGTPAPRVIAVNGSGEVRVLPDRARLNLAVDALDDDLKVAEGKVNTVVRAYLAKAKALGAKSEQIATSGSSINPEYVWDDKTRQRKLVGYRARREIVVEVDDLEKLGDFILGATKAGVNNVSPPVLESSRAQALEREALAKAAEDAQARARVLAQSVGARLGPARSIHASGSMPPPVPMKVMAMRAEAAFDSGNQEMGVSTGQISVSATVQAEFDLIVP
ncbi:MAG: SIMPL domain-containing protein [Nevskiales bacterium]|nr:SIMPL domain-containing protein [Nevskiales bacterium]